MSEAVKARTKTVIIKINANRVIETTFSSHDNANDPVTVPEVNRIIASLRSEHNKYLRLFRLGQKTKQDVPASALVGAKEGK